ncbi:MAG: hypothetical protein CFE23_11545 [Flavobacterium sp. BFFFF1]|uniref:DUF6428 family protein n=1 Tax=Flavobacterium sp. BFFFF1 TaxID=2015557 RepID=UPI000BDAD44A|nr:DUF6428 family protein [Flavobacterium sp. BFFFF1]OYU80013.1 MAG: hypothetical protein CFE23_11545 [Flavobacterium sp. BFFFF1]
MKLSDIKKHLETMETVNFQLQNGTFVPAHFHVTEVGVVTKHFIDCGGTVRNEKVANFQLWNANDVDHRLKPVKLRNIIALSERVLGLEDLEIEVEYQQTGNDGQTIGKYDLAFDGNHFILLSKATACLAQDHCGVPQEPSNASCCTPGGGCC